MMFRFLRSLLKHPVSVLLSVLLIVLMGIFSLFRIPIEIKPEQSAQGIQVVALWKRHPPEVVQRLLTQPIEEIAMELRDISSVESSSGIGTAIIQLKFPKEAELKYAYIELRERLATLKDDLPGDAVLRVEPIFVDDEAEQLFKQSFFDVELIGRLSLNELRQIAKDAVIPKLNGVDGIGRIELYGGSDGFIQVILDDELLKTVGIQPEVIHRQLQNYSINRGLGLVRDRGKTQMLVMDNRPRLINDLNHIPIRSGLVLGNVAHISFAYDDPTTLSRHNFDPLVLIRVFKAPGINAIAFSDALKEQIGKIQSQLPGETYIHIAHDDSEHLRDELKSLWFRASVILAVVFVILFVLFGRWLVSGIILLIVFLSIISASIFLYLSGYTINVVTLAGIALVFGMLVDNAVVVLENIQRYRTGGESPFGSGMRGTLEVFQPLLASTVTTVLVFLALLLLEDRLGTYYRPLALVLGFSLIASLLLAVTLIPAILIRWPGILNGSSRVSRGKKAINWYSGLLQFTIKRRVPLLVSVFILLAASGYFFWKNIDRGGFFVWGRQEELGIYVNAPRGVALEVLDNIMRNFENVIKGQNVESSTQTVVDEDNAYAYLKVNFPDSVINTVAPYVMKEYLITDAVNYAGVGIGIYGFGMPYWNGGYRVQTMYNTFLQVSGPDYYHLWEICESILDLAKMDVRVDEGIISPSIRSLYQSDLKEYRFTSNTDELWDRGFSIASVRTGAQKVFLNRSWWGEMSLGEKRYSLQVGHGDEIAELETLNRERIQVTNDTFIPVLDYFTLSKEVIQPWIDKKNQQYRFTIAWEYRGPERMRNRHEKSIVNSLNLPPGYSLEEKQWGFLTRKEESDLLKVLLVVVVGSFMILAALYESFSQPFIIFFSFPFALVGVFLSYVLFERDFNVNGYIGLILLSGIVLNNAIVLVERINQLRKRGFSLKEAIVKGGVQRIRPVLITTLTTVGGLIPLFFLGSGDTALAKMLEELSFITVSGLMSSTLLTITLIPVFYYIFEKRNYSSSHNSLM